MVISNILAIMTAAILAFSALTFIPYGTIRYTEEVPVVASETVCPVDEATALDTAGKAANVFGYAWENNFNMTREVLTWPCGENRLVMTIPFDEPSMMFMVGPDGDLLMFRGYTTMDERLPLDRDDALQLVTIFAADLWPDKTVTDLVYTDTGDGCAVSAAIDDKYYMFALYTDLWANYLEACEAEAIPYFATMPDEAVRLFAEELTTQYNIPWNAYNAAISMTEDNQWLTSMRVRKNEIPEDAAAALTQAFGDTENGWYLQQYKPVDDDTVYPVVMKRLLTIAETEDTDYYYTGIGYPDDGEWFEEQLEINGSNGQPHTLKLTLLNKLDMPDMTLDELLCEPLPGSISFSEAIEAAYQALEPVGFEATDWESCCIIFGYSLWNHVDEGPAWQLYLHAPGNVKYEMYIDAETGEVLDTMLPGGSLG